MSTGPPPSTSSSDASPLLTASAVRPKNRRFRKGKRRISASSEPSDPESHTSRQGGVQETASARRSKARDEVDDLVALVALTNLSSEDISLEGALKYLPGAIRRNQRPLVARLSSILLNGLSVDNCMDIYMLASQEALHDIESASRHVICKNFLMISETDEKFTDLPVESLDKIVFSDNVCATEEQVFRAIVRWVMKDRLVRQQYFKNLVLAVRVNRCPLKSLEEILEHFLVRIEPDFRAVVQDRIHSANSGRFDRDHLIEDSLSRAGDRNLIFVMGGVTDVKTVETLDPVRGSWVSHNITDAPSNGTWICSMDHKILVLEELNDSWRLRSFDVKAMQWAKLKTPPVFREGTCKAYFDHLLYVLGGQDPYGTLCYGYDAHTNKWKKMAAMNGKRDYAAAACFEGKLYCCGGADVSVKGVQSSLEVFDLRDGGRWSYLSSMQFARFDHSLVSCGRCLWVIGGFVGQVYLSGVERYNVDTRQWNFARTFSNVREDLSVCVLDRDIYVISGKFQRTVATRKVDIFNEEDGEWAEGIPLNTERSLHGSCVVQYLSDADADRYAVPIGCPKPGTL